ncbi:MAG: type II toxin-antitoxin system RelE/ParE family toxin [Chloroflexi bacterium]|nr:type II toxin-antitoxin system RelE/ParE family toxin [Chloroflexota bacterium]
MEILFEKSFGRDLKKIKDKRLLKQVQEAIDQVKSAASINEMPNLKKLQGFETYYRIKIANHRIGVEISEGQIIFVRFLNRKDIYRYFP